MTEMLSVQSASKERELIPSKNETRQTHHDTTTTEMQDHITMLNVLKINSTF